MPWYFLLLLCTFQVSIDQSVVDLDIPFRLGGFASTTIQLIGIVGVMTNVTWQVFLLIIPTGIACLWMQVISVNCLRFFLWCFHYFRGKKKNQ